MENNILQNLCSSTQLEALSKFKVRILYSNLDRDFMVSYQSSAIRRSNAFYENRTLAVELSRQPRPYILEESTLEIRETAEDTVQSQIVEEMTKSLLQLNWRRFLVVPDRWFYAHEDMVHKTYRPLYGEILNHTVTTFVDSIS